MAQKRIRLRRTKDVLIDVDIQPAFLSGGGAAVPDGDAIIPVVKVVHRSFVRAQRFLTLFSLIVGHAVFLTGPSPASTGRRPRR